MKGHINERRPGVWLVRADGGLDPVSGKRRQPARVVHGTKADAELALAQLVVDLGKGIVPGTTATLEQLIERWFKHAERRLSPTTVRGYRRLANQRIIPRFGDRRLSSITTHELDVYYDGLAGSGLSDQTIRHVHSIIRRAYAHAVRWGWVQSNPAAYAQPPVVHRQRRGVLTVGQVHEALATSGVECPEFGVFVRLALATGARRGELAALRWTDIDLAVPTVRIARSIAAVDGGLLEKPTKTMKERTVGIDPRTADVLAEHRKLMSERAAIGGVELDAAPFVFSNQLACDQPWHPDTITHMWMRMRSTSTIPSWARLHDVRHAHASMLIDAGVPVATVSERLGHVNLNITLGVYTHAYKQRDLEAASTIGRLLDGDLS